MTSRHGAPAPKSRESSGILTNAGRLSKQVRRAGVTNMDFSGISTPWQFMHTQVHEVAEVDVENALARLAGLSARRARSMRSAHRRRAWRGPC